MVLQIKEINIDRLGLEKYEGLLEREGRMVRQEKAVNKRIIIYKTMNLVSKKIDIAPE